MPPSRDDTLAVLRGQKIARLPVFSGLPSLAAPALNAAGIRYSESHTDPEKMARAAASTFEMFGFASAVAPFDLCVEAEALGCGLDYQGEWEGFLAPVVSAPLSVPAAPEHLAIPMDVTRAGRVPLVADAVRRLAQRVGREVLVGAWAPGPFTLAWQLFGADAWLSTLHNTQYATRMLSTLADFLARVARHYRAAGADFITVHEMGGSPQVIGPATFRSLVKPAIRQLISQLPSPHVLSVCGDTNAVVTDLAECGADALSVDHRNDLARTRQTLGLGAVLLGNFDPLGVLANGTPASVADAVRGIARAGANAVWPGCDLWPDLPAENFRALMEAAREL